ncbi:hypothetical protein HY251_14185 [bacterium]|nr:hypothetical protein [bacterium]
MDSPREPIPAPERPSKLKRLGKACLLIVFVVLLVVSIAFLAAVYLTEGPDRLSDEATTVSVSNAPEGRIFVSPAVIDVTPKEPVFIAGYGANRLSTGVHDPITARAITIMNERGTAVTLLTLDLIGLHHSDAQAPMLTLPEIVLDGKSVSVLTLTCATHNHEGPDTLGLWGKSRFSSGVDPNVLRRCAEGAQEAVRAAGRYGEPCRVILATAQAPSQGISRNRRDPNLIDRTVTTLSFVSEKDNKTVATIVHFACHPETLGSKNTLLSADFPHYLNDEVEKRRGGVSLFLNGALGGMVTTDEKEESFAEAERIGRAIGTIACDSLESKDAVTLETAPLAWVQEKIQVPIQNRMFHAAARLGVVNRPWKDGYVESEVDAIRLGPLTFVTAPGEVTPKVGFQLTDMIPSRFKGVVSLASDELGYIIDEQDYADPSKFHYERTMSPGPLATTLIRATAKDAIARVTSAN